MPWGVKSEEIGICFQFQFIIILLWSKNLINSSHVRTRSRSIKFIYQLIGLHNTNEGLRSWVGG